MKSQNPLRGGDGNRAEHERIYRTHKSRIAGLCRLLLLDADEAEDVVQDVFVRAFERLRSDEPPQVWEAWLVRVAVNACRDRQRSGWWKSRRKRVEVGEAHLGLAPSVEAESIGRERQARVWQQLRKLKAQQRTVFVLRYIEGWSTEEVASSLGLSAGGVKTHLFRAVRHLRKAMEP